MYLCRGRATFFPSPSSSSSFIPINKLATAIEISPIGGRDPYRPLHLGDAFKSAGPCASAFCLFLIGHRRYFFFGGRGACQCDAKNKFPFPFLLLLLSYIWVVLFHLPRMDDPPTLLDIRFFLLSSRFCVSQRERERRTFRSEQRKEGASLGSVRVQPL